MNPAPSRAARRAADLAAAAEHQPRPPFSIGRGRDLHRAAAELERLTGEGGPEGLHGLGQPLGSLRRRDPVHLELTRHVAGAEHEIDPATTDVVEHHEVFGEAQRVVERCDQRGDHEPDVRGASGHRGSISSGLGR